MLNLNDGAVISAERRRLLSLLEDKIAIHFNSIALLNQAFCHCSFSNEELKGSPNNEKLEFLGDSILGMVICHCLYSTFTDKNEGDLARLKSFLVSEESLAQSAVRLDLSTYLLIGKGEERTGGRFKKAILADCMEALFAAIYLDQGYEVAEKFILDQLANQIILARNERHEQDYKTVLQEYCQKKYKKVPVYNVVAESGPDHDKKYWVEVLVNEHAMATAEGRNKKEAERYAAKIAYMQLRVEE